MLEQKVHAASSSPAVPCLGNFLSGTRLHTVKESSHIERPCVRALEGNPNRMAIRHQSECQVEDLLEVDPLAMAIPAVTV